MATISKAYIFEKIQVVLLASLYAYFLYIHGSAFLEHQRLSSLLYVIFETIILAMTVIRTVPKSVSFSFYDWSIALAGLLMPLLMQATSLPEATPLYALQIFGIFISIAGILALNRNFDIVAANRGTKKSGIYKIVRHPIYLGYFISLPAFCLQNMTSLNLMIIVMHSMIQIMRIIAEEKFLSQDQEYVEYKKTTRWRVIPFVW